MEQTLIDLSTPSKHQPIPSRYSQDFTPTLSRKLAESFKRRKQSLLPRHALPTRTNLFDLTNNSSQKQETDTQQNLSLVLEETTDIDMQESCLLEERMVSFQTPDIKVSAKFDWKELIKGTPAAHSPMGDAENQQLTTQIQCITTKSLQLDYTTPRKSNGKRGPSTPVTPSFLKQSVKRRVLGNKPNGSRPFTPSQLGDNPWIIDQASYPLEVPVESSPITTPKSVIQMRRILKSMPRRGGKQKYGPLRNELFARYPQSITSEVIDTEFELDKPTHGDGEFLVYYEAVSCNDKETDYKLENEYEKWISDQQLKELQGVVEFMELERQFNV